MDDERITIDSVNTFAEWYFAGFARITDNLVDEEDRRAVYATAQRILLNVGLSKRVQQLSA